MNDYTLLAQSTDAYWFWNPTNLTTIWILSVGVALGLVIVLALFLAMFLLSKIPWVGSLAENDRLKKPVIGVLSVVYFSGLMAWVGYSLSQRGAIDGAWDLVTQAGVLLLASAAFAIVAAIGTVALVSRRMVAELPMAVKEGVLYWVTVICCGLTGFAVLGMAISWASGLGIPLIVRDPVDKLSSYPRTFVTGRRTTEYKIEKYDDRDDVIEVNFDGRELQSLEFDTDQELIVSTRPINDEIAPNLILRIPVKLDSVSRFAKTSDPDSPIPDALVEQLHVRNMGEGVATLRLTVDTTPDTPEVATITLAAICVVLIYLLYLVQRSTMPKVSAVALATFKSECSQPLFIIFLLVGSLFMLVSIYIPYNTFGEDIKMLKDSGLTVILLAGIFHAVWASSRSVAEEIEGKTALTVLSKPIGRRQFILGKFLGISWSTALLFIVLGLVFLFWVAYKPVYDARESSTDDIFWQTCHAETMQIIPGLVLAFMEVVVFIAISVAISTRLPMMANFLICFAIYVLGHLTPLIVQSTTAVEAFEGVIFFGRLIATIFPVLDHFNVQAAVAGGTTISLEYLGYAFIYCFIYGTIAMLLALVLFEDRDLA